MFRALDQSPDKIKPSAAIAGRCCGIARINGKPTLDAIQGLIADPALVSGSRRYEPAPGVII